MAMNPNVDDARLLKRHRLLGAADSFVMATDGAVVVNDAARDQYARFIAWGRSNGYAEFDDDEFGWAFTTAWQAALR